MQHLKKKKQINYAILVHDVFPENTLSARIIKSNKSVVYKILKKLFDEAYCCADNLIVCGRDMKELIKEKTNKDKNSEIELMIKDFDIG